MVSFVEAAIAAELYANRPELFAVRTQEHALAVYEHIDVVEGNLVAVVADSGVLLFVTVAGPDNSAK